MSTRLETARLIVRSFEQRDAQAWLALVNDPDVTRFTPPGPPATLETFHEAIKRRHEMERERGYAMWAVDLKESGAFAGQCGLFPAERTGPEIELAYHFTTASWNKGFATEAAIAVLDRAFASIALQRVIAVVMTQNIGSWRVLEKVGMRFAGTATYYGLTGLKKYHADREWWTPPLDRYRAAQPPAASASRSEAAARNAPISCGEK